MIFLMAIAISNGGKCMRNCLRFAVRVTGLLLVASLAAPASQAAVLRLAVSTTPLSTPFYVADKLGLFAEEGLQVTIADCNGGKLCLAQALSGARDLATASELPIMFSSFTRSDFSIVATFASTSRNVKLVTRNSAGIKLPKDLAGRRVGLVRGAAGEYFLDLVLLTYGVDPAKVAVVDMAADAMGAAARSGQVDVFATFEPGTWHLLNALKHDGHVLTLPTIYTMTFNLAGLNKVVAERGRDIPKLLRALDKAVRFIDTNPQAAQAILAKRLGVDRAFVAATWGDYRFNVSLNQSLLTNLESQARWAVRKKLATGTVMPDYLDMVQPAALSSVRPDSVTLVK